MIGPLLGFLLGLLLVIVYIAVVVYFFVLLSRLVSAAERISQNIETGVAAFRESRRQPSAGWREDPLGK